MNEMTYREADSILDYNPSTGALTWKVDVSRSAKAGSLAGCYRLGRSPVLQYKGKDYPIAKIVWVLMRRVWPEQQMYFIDGEKRNLRFNNLTDDFVYKKKISLAYKKKAIQILKVEAKKAHLADEKKAELSIKVDTIKAHLIKIDGSNISDKVTNILPNTTENPYGGHPGLIDENSENALVSLVNPNANLVMKTVTETKPRNNGKARLTQFGDLPERIKCVCPKCYEIFYKTKINYTRTVPSFDYYCKKCDRKEWKYTFEAKVAKVLEAIEKIDTSEVQI